MRKIFPPRSGVRLEWDKQLDALGNDTVRMTKRPDVPGEQEAERLRLTRMRLARVEF
jgi:hypothetical protein